METTHLPPYRTQLTGHYLNLLYILLQHSFLMFLLHLHYVHKSVL